MSEFRKLRDICTRITDGSHYSPPASDSGYPMLSVKDMRSYDFDFSDCKLISGAEFEKMVRNGCVPRKNDVVIAKDGSYLKNVFVITEDRDIAVLSSIGILRPDVTNVDPYYLKYYLSSGHVKREVSKKYVTGSALPRIILENFGEIEIPIIPLESQKKIVEVLKCIDDKIANNNAIISELEAMAKDIYDYWFVQFDFPDENGRPYKSNGGKMVWNETLKREIPEGWKPTRFGDLVTVKRGISYSASNLVDAGLPMINLNSFTPSATYKTSGIKYYKGEVKDGGQVNAYDLLMCTTQQTDIDGKTDIIGKTMLIPDLFDSQMVFSMDLVKIQTDELMKTVIVSETKTPWYNKYITGFATGTSILHLKLDGFLTYQIPLPKDTAILKRFNSMYMEWERRKSIAMKENEELTALRDWLLPMLMNGQVKVGGVA